MNGSASTGAIMHDARPPKTPQSAGARIAQGPVGGAELYRAAADQADLVERYAHGTPDDWIERHLYQRYNFVGIGVMLAIDVVLFGILGVAIWAIQMVWIPFFAAGVINGIGALLGYRNFESARCGDQHLALGHPDRRRGTA